MNVVQKISVPTGLAMIHATSFAQNFKLNDVRGTSGAGNKDLNDLLRKGGETAQSGADFVIIFFALAGLLLFGIGLFALYKAGKEERESPKGAIIACLVGGALTAVTVLLGLTRNTFGV